MPTQLIARVGQRHSYKQEEEKMTKSQRTTFKTSRAAQYLESRALTAMTGKGKDRFADVVVKELLDNALDACETSGVAPEVTLGVEERLFGEVVITVGDNAGGIPESTVHDALDFNVLVSDKAAYRSPTRGAQGNALKTVFGIPYALGSLEPVTIEAGNTRHEARVWKDPAGQLRVQCDDTNFEIPRAGTSITAHVPSGGTGGRFDPEYWTRAFSLFNPHALVRFQRFEESYHGKSGRFDSEDFYHPTRDPAKRFKYVLTDPTSPHWYDEDTFRRLLYSYIGHHRVEGGEDLLLRDFVRQFKGLSATKKAKAVCEACPKIKTLSDFEEAPDSEAASLLEGMQLHTDPPSTATLGFVGKDHFEQLFENFYGDLLRYDYKKISGALHTGMPYVFEFAIAELDADEWGRLFTAVNYSPTFGDPLSDVYFVAPDFRAVGIDAFLKDGFAHPRLLTHDDPDPPNTAVAVHVITPAPLYLDQGKTRLEGFSYGIDEDIAKAMASKVRPYYKEGKRRVKGKRTRERTPRGSVDREMSLKDATAAVLEEAWRHTTGNGQLPVGARRLFYAVRSRIPALTSNTFSTDNGYSYFSQTLLPEYQKERVKEGKEPLAGVYYDPRGKIHEAHTGKSMDLGTRDVDSYEFPPYTFNKLLYVEKRGQVPLLQAAKIAERYDMALVTEAGFATVAARTLLASGASEAGEKYQVFCLHDADYSGYNILRTLREATARMPEHSMEVYDIGLTVEQVMAKGKTPETYVRSSTIPEQLMPLLNEPEREWFVGEYLGTTGKKHRYSSKRFELDDLTAPEVIEHIESRLEELGVEPKVIPPDEVLAEQGKDLYREKARAWVDEVVAEVLATDELKDKMAKEFEDRFKLQGARAWIETEFDKRDDSKSWRGALRGTLQRAYSTKHKDAFEEVVREHIRQIVADDE
jgi:DNA topoisomerase 6 subunit A-like protein